VQHVALTPLLVLGIAVVVLLGTALARRTSVPDPVVLVAVGLLTSLVPSVPHLQLPPELVFLVFLPPLLYRASFLTPPQTLRQHATAIALLAVGLVATTAVAVGAVVSWLVPGLTFSEGLLLGALVAPTDPVAAANVFERLGAPRRVVDLVESESLVNDATALVLFGLALEAVTSGPPSLGWLGLTLLWTVVGGVGTGLALGLLVLPARERISDVGLQLLLSLVTPYAAYLVADEAGASGVLAVVTVGVIVGSRGRESAGVRLQVDGFWSLLDLVLNALLFVLLGLQVRSVLDDVPDLGVGRLLLYGAVVLAVVVMLRLAWQFVAPPISYGLRALAGRDQQRSTTYERLLIGWTGMRGAISLAAALSLPLDLSGRPLLVFLTIVVVLGTLLLQGLTLPALVRRADLTEQDDAQEQLEREVRVALADVALSRLDELEARGELPGGGADPLRSMWEHARARADHGDDPEVDLVDLRLDIAHAQGEELERRKGDLPPELVRELRQELDLQQVRLGGDDARRPRVRRA
jgi:Na+/H+ antiporter